MSKEQLLMKQTEKTRINLVEIAEDTEMDEALRWFARAVSQVVEFWQIYAKDENPTSHQIDFGVGTPIGLLMILALLPERYQGLICIEDEHRSPSCDGDNLSWLHEQTTDVLVRLSMDPDASTRLFGEGIASMVRNDVDQGWRAFTGRSWLEDQVHLLSNNELESDLYRFPPGTEKIIFFFNPTAIHWTVVEVSLEENDAWIYSLYNSLSLGERGATWKACLEQFPLLEHLICQASGFAEPATREIVTADSAQQENTYDCGPIAVYNAMELLEGRKPSTDIDPDVLRFRYLNLILDALYGLENGFELPVFRAHMRKVWLRYPE